MAAGFVTFFVALLVFALSEFLVIRGVIWLSGKSRRRDFRRKAERAAATHRAVRHDLRADRLAERAEKFTVEELSFHG